MQSDASETMMLEVLAKQSRSYARVSLLARQGDRRDASIAKRCSAMRVQSNASEEIQAQPCEPSDASEAM